jgi:hypothetical protein
LLGLRDAAIHTEAQSTRRSPPNPQSRHCEERSDAAIHTYAYRRPEATQTSVWIAASRSPSNDDFEDQGSGIRDQKFMGASRRGRTQNHAPPNILAAAKPPVTSSDT